MGRSRRRAGGAGGGRAPCDRERQRKGGGGAHNPCENKKKKSRGGGGAGERERDPIHLTRGTQKNRELRRGLQKVAN